MTEVPGRRWSLSRRQSEAKDFLWRAPSLIASSGRRPAAGLAVRLSPGPRADGWRRTETSRAGGGALPWSDWPIRPQSAREVNGDRTVGPTFSPTDARQGAEKTTSAALASLSARAEKLFQEIAAALRRVEDLEAALQEKTAQGGREAEDIRAQIAPLLETHAQKEVSDRRVPAEFDRLRESLADSLADIADRLRRAVGGS